MLHTERGIRLVSWQYLCAQFKLGWAQRCGYIYAGGFTVSLFVNVVTYSGWAGTLFSVAYIFVQRLEGRREKEQKEQLSRMLAHLSAEPVLLGADSESSRTRWPVSRTRNERIRSALIRAAAERQSLNAAFKQVQGFECDEAELLEAAHALAGSGLLHFEEPLNLNSVLSLRV